MIFNEAMSSQQAISKVIYTHFIAIMNGNICKTIYCTDLEANKALELWAMWRPVPVPIPNKEQTDAKRAVRYVNPTQISEISIRRF